MSGRYALMWSGGKDSALALDRASRAGIEVVRLVSLYDSATRRVRFHSTRVEMLEAQAAAIGLGLRAIPTSWPEMEANLRYELLLLREEGFTGVVFGDIHLADVRAWYEERVIAAGLEHVEPIWGEPPNLLLAKFISSGGRAVAPSSSSAGLRIGMASAGWVRWTPASPSFRFAVADDDVARRRSGHQDDAEKGPRDKRLPCGSTGAV